MKNNTWYRLLAGLLCAVLLLTAAVSAWVLADEEIHIASAEDFADFIASCTLDTWSQRKRFVLDCDITLESADFVPAATFGGVFLGAGHTIRGLSITDSAAPTGLFCVLQEGASIRDLNVEGSVNPEGDTGSVGGIVGENHGTISGCSFTGTVTGTRDVGGIAGFNTATGVIRFCRTSGALFGENRSGGVAGTNQGLISASRNNMYVNIESTDPSIDLSRIDLDFSLDLTRLTRMDTANIATDTGGIAGYSSGTIRDCANAAAIGHEHIGYNVGGIVGRSCGQIRSCTNKGGVCGRKDVGGIAGQIEPYIEMQLSESALSKVEKQLNELNDLGSIQRSRAAARVTPRPRSAARSIPSTRMRRTAAARVSPSQRSRDRSPSASVTAAARALTSAHLRVRTSAIRAMCPAVWTRRRRSSRHPISAG